MNIVHVITRLIIGGAQENTVLTCRGLVEAGHDVTLIAGEETGPEGSLWDQAEASGATLVKARSLRRAVRPVDDWRAVAELERIFRAKKPDIVHTHSSKAGIIGREAAHRAGVSGIVHTIHGMSFNRTQPWATQALYRFLERRAGRFTRSFVSVADAMTAQAVAAGLGPRERFTTIRSGMDTDGFAPNEAARRRVRAAWGVENDSVVVGTIARLFDNKGYDEIMAAMPEAIRRAPHVRFVWVGDGARRWQYEHRLETMGLRDRVHFVGLIAPMDVGAAVNGFDIVLHASRWEGLPRALVQGLLAEVPAISFDNDGAPEVVIPNETGLLVPLGDTGRLADAIACLASDAALRRTLGARGRERCLREFDWRTMVRELDALYRGNKMSGSVAR